MPPKFDVFEIHAQFPAFARRIGGQPAIYFDGPAWQPGAPTGHRCCKQLSG